MIPKLVVCGGRTCGGGEVFFDEAIPATGVRRAGFRYVCKSGYFYGARSDGSICERRGEWGLILFSHRFVAFVAEPRGYILAEIKSGAPAEDYPAPPLPGLLEDGSVYWGRLVVEEGGGLYLLTPWGSRASGLLHSGDSPLSLNDLGIGRAYFAADMLATRYNAECLQLYARDRTAWEDKCTAHISSAYFGLDPRFPGTGKLTGEEFRVVEPDADYLRLIGRGGEEHLAWDFVLGTLDSGEWVLLGEDGLYLARRLGGRVVVEGPYDGPLYEVRGPPKAYAYPVVPTRTFRAATSVNPGLASVLLKWPLSTVKYEIGVSLGPFYHLTGPCCAVYE
ncbi:MAG: hypothetical protein QXI84_09405 [Thermofilaceae archaeon]